MNQTYGIDDIKSLSFRDGVRTRIQMYLGSDDLDGTYQAFKEIINNSYKVVDIYSIDKFYENIMEVYNRALKKFW